MSQQAPLIHIVDDDTSVRRSLGRLLRSMGLRTRLFSSGPELLADDSGQAAACALVDVHMPEMNGYELARLLAEREPGPLVIFISAHVEEEKRWHAEAEGAVGLLLKPFSQEELGAALRKALGEDLGRHLRP